tara:strand:+ start:844 stop:1089 length:246 start_codon:yes stop_codon:yes gene_type:complete
MIQKLSLSLQEDTFTILKVDGIGFSKDPEGEENLDSRCEHLKLFEPGTKISVYDFFSDPNYYTKMYSIVNGSKMNGVVINV